MAQVRSNQVRDEIICFNSGVGIRLDFPSIGFFFFCSNERMFFILRQ